MSSSINATLPLLQSDFFTHLPLSLLSYVQGLSTTLQSSLADNPTATALLPQSWTSLVLTAGLGYLVLCRALRYRREAALRRRYGFPDRESLQRMTAEEAQRIIVDITTLEFPQFAALSLQFALFKTYGVESISKLLLATRNLTDPVASLKRFEDTGIIIGEFVSNPPNSPRAITAVARMNFLHSKYVASGQISNEDFLYTLSVFITEPERWFKLYEWRPLNDMEVCAFGAFWKSIGDAMGIRYAGLLGKTEWTDGLDFARDIARWAKGYEVVAFTPSVVSNKPARALIPILTYWIPAWAQGFAHECVCVMLGDRVREAFMLPEPGISAALTVYTGLWLRRFVLRHLCLPRIFPTSRHVDNARQNIDKPLTVNFNYGDYPFYIKPTLWNRWGPGAWAWWLIGGTLPGDKPESYFPEGFRFVECEYPNYLLCSFLRNIIYFPFPYLLLKGTWPWRD